MDREKLFYLRKSYFIIDLRAYRLYHCTVGPMAKLQNQDTCHTPSSYSCFDLILKISGGSGGGLVVKLLACKRSGARFSVSPLEFQRFVISWFQVAKWLKYR